MEDWDKVSTKDLIKVFSEGTAWNFFSTPIRMQAFIESSLAEIIYKYEYNMIISDDSLKGTVAAKSATAEIETQNEHFALQYRKLYTSYVTEVLKSFNDYLKRLERIIDFRLQEERLNANRNPFS